MLSKLNKKMSFLVTFFTFLASISGGAPVSYGQSAQSTFVRNAILEEKVAKGFYISGDIYDAEVNISISANVVTSTTFQRGLVSKMQATFVRNNGDKAIGEQFDGTLEGSAFKEGVEVVLNRINIDKENSSDSVSRLIIKVGEVSDSSFEIIGAQKLVFSLNLDNFTPKAFLVKKFTWGDFPSVVELLSSSDSFSTLKRLVVKAGLVEMLTDRYVNYSIFAPTNAAFEKFGRRKLFELEKQPAELKKFLLNHVAAQRVKPGSSRFALKGFSTLSGSRYRLQFSNQEPVLVVPESLAEIDISTSNISINNGIVHVVDEVLDVD